VTTDLKTKKKQLEKKILVLIRNFEKESKIMRVESINIHHTCDINGDQEVVGIEAEVRL